MQNRHKTPIQVRFKDVDALGHVNNANHLTYFELARMRYFDEIIGGEIDWEQAGMILARVAVDYRQPIFLKDHVFVYTWLNHVGNTSFELGCQLVREEADGRETELAAGAFVIVCYSYTEQKPVPVPAAWAERMKAFQERS